MVAFLSELLYISEIDAVAFDNIRVQVREGRLLAEMDGAPIASAAKEIKAVTYHNLAIRSYPEGLRVRIVFDV